MGTAAPIIATVALGAQVGGAISSAMGASQQASAQAQMYNYQAGIAQQNAAIAKQNASYALLSGESEAARSGMATGARIGAITAGQAASGLDVNSGTNVSVRDSQRNLGEMDQATIRTNAAKRAYDFDIGAFQDTEQAGIYSSAASGAVKAGQINVMSSILGSVGSVASKWSQGSQAGLV